MAFRLQKNEYFHGVLIDRTTRSEIVAVHRATRAFVIKLTVGRAQREGKDWRIELRLEVPQAGDRAEQRVLKQWHSTDGVLPPPSRAAAQL